MSFQLGERKSANLLSFNAYQNNKDSVCEATLQGFKLLKLHLGEGEDILFEAVSSGPSSILEIHPSVVIDGKSALGFLASR